MPLIQVSEFPVELTRKRVKNINLRIDSQGTIRVSAPKHCPLAFIHQFLQEKQAWIKTQQARLRQRPFLSLREEKPAPALVREMRELLPSLIHKWEAIIGVTVQQWGIKTMKTRWGSCNPLKRRIWLNAHLVHYPPICLEYVVVHELVHLLEASHNARFHALMSQFMPQWREYKALLR